MDMDPVKMSLGIVRETLRENRSASKRFASHSHASLISLAEVLSRIEAQLQIAKGDKSKAEHLDEIVVGGPAGQRMFFHGLGVDMRILCTYLRSADPTSDVMNQADVSAYVEIFNRYDEVMKAVWGPSKEYVMATHLAPVWLTISSVNI
jgi:hypothetical protein